MNPEPRFTAGEYAARLAKTRAAMEAKGIELLIVSDPSNMHWLTGYDGWSFYVHQAVIVPPAGNPVWFGRGQDAAGAQRTSWLPDADIVGYPDHYVQSAERHPMDFLAGVLAERGLDRLAHRRRDGQLLVLRRRLREPAARPPERPLPGRHRPRELAARGEEPDRDRLHEAGRPHRRGDARPHRREGPPRHPQVRPRRRDLRRRHPRHARLWRRLPRHSAAAAFRARRFRPASHLGRQADEVGRGHLLRDRRLLPSLPLPAVAHRVPRETDAGVPRRRSRDAGRHGRRPRRGETRQRLRGHRQRLLRRPREARHRQGQPHRLLDRPQLPARLGRAHHEPAPRRPHRAPRPA